MTGFDLDTLAVRWRRQQDHASHLLLYEDTGELVTGDHADVVVLDIATDTELARADTGSGMQSVLFPAPGFERDFYVCSFLTVSRVLGPPTETAQARPRVVMATMRVSAPTRSTVELTMGMP